MKLSPSAWLAVAAILSISGAAATFALQPPGDDRAPGFDGPPPIGGDYGPPPRGGDAFDGPPPRGREDFGGPGPRGGRPPGPPRGEGFDTYGPGPDERRGPAPPPPTPLEASDEKLRGLLDQENELRRETERLADDVRREGVGNEELQAAIARQFDLRHEIRQRKIELLEQQLAALKGALSRRQEQRELLIEARMAELLDLPSPVDF